MTKCFSFHKIAKDSATVKRHKAAHWPIEEFQFQQNEVNIQASYVTVNATKLYSLPVTLLFLFLIHKGTSAYNWQLQYWCYMNIPWGFSHEDGSIPDNSLAKKVSAAASYFLIPTSLFQSLKALTCSKDWQAKWQAYV